MGFLDFLRRRRSRAQGKGETVLRPGALAPSPGQAVPEWMGRLAAAEEEAEREWEDGESEQPVEERGVVERTGAVVARLKAAGGEGQAQAFYAAVDEGYAQAARPYRDALRRAVADDEQLDSLVGAQLRRHADQAVGAGDFIEGLRASLLVYSLTTRYDSRDALMTMAGLWRWAEHKGLDPMPHFRAIGRISSPEETHLYGGSAKAMMMHVAISAEYRAKLQA